MQIIVTVKTKLMALCSLRSHCSILC